MTARETRARACESTMAWHRRPPRGVRVGPFCMLAFSFGAVRDGRGLKVSTTGGRHGQRTVSALSAGPCMYGLLSWRGPCGVHTGKNDAHTQSRTRTRPQSSTEVTGAVYQCQFGFTAARRGRVDAQAATACLTDRTREERECVPAHPPRGEPRLAFAGTGMPRLARLPSVQLDEPRNPQVCRVRAKRRRKGNPDLDVGLSLC